MCVCLLGCVCVCVCARASGSTSPCKAPALARHAWCHVGTLCTNMCMYVCICFMCVCLFMCLYQGTSSRAGVALIKQIWVCPEEKCGIDRERPGNPGSGVGEETQRRPPLPEGGAQEQQQGSSRKSRSLLVMLIAGH